ncbi:nucleotidyltransferase domain-containing protein [Candidatus Woesearchaeota archaeon]|nr:nucleotidyltransferase domain-containing protein [Candidatus Woesearchaeota archaeon]
MSITKLLPLSKGKLDVLFEIYAEGQDYLRNISRKLKMNPSQSFRILNSLYKAKIVVKKEIGNEIQYSMSKDYDSEPVIIVLEEYHLYKIVDRSDALKAVLALIFSNKKLFNSSDKIYLFGSYVTGNATKNSDIDLLFVNEDNKLVGKACREMSVVSGVTINPLIYTKKKFKDELKKGEALLSSIVNNVKNRAIVK